MLCRASLVMVVALTGAAVRAQEPAATEEPAAQTDPTAEAKALYDEGKNLYDTADYAGAIRLWTKAYGLLPANAENASAKASILYNLAKAHEDEFDLEGSVKQLKTARKLLQNFEGAIPAIYGDGEEAQSERDRVQKRIAEIDAKIEDAEENVPEPAEPAEPQDPEPEPEPAAPRPGRPFVISGAVIGGVGIAAVGTAAATGAMSAGANDFSGVGDMDFEDRVDQIERGERLNKVAIATAVVGGVLVPTGVALLVVGILKNKRAGSSVSVTPTGSRGFAGVAVSGRF